MTSRGEASRENNSRSGPSGKGGRPQSMMALSLAAQIDSAFSLDGTSDVDNLAKSINYKRREVDQQAQELEALERRLRETEERLKARVAGGIPGSSSSSSTHQQQLNPSSSSPYPQRQPTPTYQRSSTTPSASASQTSFHHTNSFPRSPGLEAPQPVSGSRSSSRTPSFQQMNQAYQASGGGQRYVGAAGGPAMAGYGQQQAYPYRTASGR